MKKLHWLWCSLVVLPIGQFIAAPLPSAPPVFQLGEPLVIPASNRLPGHSRSVAPQSASESQGFVVDYHRYYLDWSPALRVTALAGIKLGSPRWTASGLQMNILGEAGLTCAVQTATSLGNWQTWTNLVMSGNQITITDPSAQFASRRFYRVLKP